VVQFIHFNRPLPPMNCREFLESYSDFRDGLLSDGVRRRMSRHLSSCSACARFNASVRHGVYSLRRAAEDLTPSPEFRDRLRARIAAGAHPAEPVSPGAAGLAALLMLAAAVALLVNEGAGRRADTPAPQQAASIRPLVVVNPGVPFVTFTDLSVPAFLRPPAHLREDHQAGTWANLPR
jgi:anti-sigma factor RsiW